MKNISKEKKRIFIELAILTGIVILLQLVGNTIKIGEFSVSLILLPIVVGGALCGPIGGAWLGFVFGLVLILSGETDAFWAISPFFTFLACAIRGAVTGLVSGLVYRAVAVKKEGFGTIVAAITAPVVNTGYFILSCLAFFYDTFAAMMGQGNVAKGLVTSYVGINFLLELALNMVFAPVLVRLSKRIEKRDLFKKTDRNGNNRKLATRLIVGAVLLGVVVCSVSYFGEYKNYKKNLEQQHNDIAYCVAELTESYLNKDLLKEYKTEANKIRDGQLSIDARAKITESADYTSMLSTLENLCQKTGTTSIRIFSADINMLAAGDSTKNAVICFFDFNCEAEKSLTFGDATSINPELIDCLILSVPTGEYPESILITNTEDGSSITAFINVYDKSSGEYLATITVESAMSNLSVAIRNDLRETVAEMLSLEIIFITLYFYYVSSRVIEPIKVISGEVTGFVAGKNSSGGNVVGIKSRDEIQQLAENIVKMEKDINSYIDNITSITAEREQISAELNVATKIQADMLPSIFPAFPERKDFDIFASMTPAKEVGGDFYDFFMIDENRIALVIADVSGKGVPAALFMVVAKTLLKNHASFVSSPKAILEAVNNQLCKNNSSEMFVTAWLCIFDVSTGKCLAANAGHEYPAIRKADGDFELIHDPHGFVLAGFEDFSYTEYEFTVEKGGTLFVYTDGVPEATNSDEELFGTERMLKALNKNSKASPDELIGNVKGAIDGFVEDAPQFDDITMLSIKRL